MHLLPEWISVAYIGRKRSSSPSEGDPTSHINIEQNRIITQAINAQSRGG